MGSSYEPSVNRSDTTRAIEGTYDAQRRLQDFLGTLQGRQDAIGNQNAVFGSALNTLGNLQGQANGTATNPGLALATTQNLQNQAALMAGQRGVGANPGLAARQIGQVGAGVQQQSATQGQLIAQQQIQQQQALLGQLAGQQVGQQQNALGTLGQYNLNQTGLFTGNLDAASKYNAENSFGAKLGNIAGGLIGAGGTIGAAALTGGASLPAQAAAGAAGAVSAGNSRNNPMGPVPFYSDGGKISGKPKTKGDSEENDTVPAMLSPGEVVIPRTAVKDPKKVAAFINDTLGFNLKVGGSKKS